MIWDRTNRPLWLRCAVGVLVAVIAAAIRLQFLGILGSRVTFVTFFPAVAFAALYGGLGPGLLATVASAALADYLWMEPVRQFGITNFADLMSMVVFLASGALLSYLAEAAYRAQARAHEAEEQSRLAVEREKADALLQRQAELLHLSYDAIIVWQLGGSIESWNKGAEELYGYSQEEAAGQVTHDLLKTVHAESWTEIEAKLRERKFWEGELRHRTRDGQEVIVSARIQLVLGADGVGRVLETNRDITERKRMEEELRKSRDELELRVQERTAELRGYMAKLEQSNQALSEAEEKYRDIFEGALEGIYQTSPQGQSLIANPALAKTLGYDSPEDVVFLVTDSAHQVWADPNERAEYARLLETNDVILNFECRYLRKDKTKIWVSLNSRRVVGPDGKTLYYSGFIEDISDRKQAERELNEINETLEQRVAERTAELAASEERLKRSQEIAHLGSWDLDLVNNRLSWSDEVYRIFGLKPQEFPATYEAFLETVHPDDRAAVDAAYSDSVSEGRDTYEIEHRLIRKLDGEVRIVHEKCEHFRDDSGHIIRSVGMVHDITERKRAEEELRESRSRLDLALGSAQMGVWRLDLIENKRHFDDQVCHLLGIDRVEFAGTEEELYKAVHPEDREMLKAVWARTVAHDVPYETEYRAVWPDGSVHYLTSRGKSVHDDKGLPVRINGLIWDITERKRAEDAIRESEAKLQAALASIPDAVFISDAEGRLVNFNDGFATYHRFRSRGECSKKITECPTYLDAYMADGRPAPLEMWAISRALRGEKVTNTEYTLRRKDTGETWTGSYSFSPIRDEDGVIIGSVVVARDITEQQQIREELRKSRDELELRVRERTAELNSYMTKLEQSNQALQDFASIASHDLQEPLRKVTAFGNMLKQKCGNSLEDQGRDYLERILNANRRMQSLLTGLLDYSRVATASEPFKEVELSDLIGKVLSDLEVRIERTGAEVHVGDLPVISADPTQMRQLFQNLIGNALKFHKPGGTPEVQVRSVTNTGSGCQITVEDNGIGFDERYLDTIFAPFQRLHGRGEYEGSGMGLAICKKIVERHGGSITATSTPGVGSLFVVSLHARQAG